MCFGLYPYIRRIGSNHQSTWRSAVFPAYLANQVLATNRESERAVVTRGLRKQPDPFFCSPASASYGSAPIRPKGMTYRFLDSEVAGLYQGSAVHEPSCHLREDNATIPADNHWADIKCRSL
jgi:hypothetical protein